MVSLHPRTRSQGYEGKSDWSHIARLAAILKIPVAGSGDLWNAEDAAAMLKETGCAAVMFARGALGNPFIFCKTRALLSGTASNGAALDGSTSIERKFNMAIDHLEALAKDLVEKRACLEMRKIFCAYIKGIPQAASIKCGAVKASSIADYRALAARILKK